MKEIRQPMLVSGLQITYFSMNTYLTKSLGSESNVFMKVLVPLKKKVISYKYFKICSFSYHQALQHVI